MSLIEKLFSVSSSPSKEIKKNLHQSQFFFDEVLFEEALFYSDKVLDTDEKNILALTIKAASLYKLEKYDEAINNYNQVLNSVSEQSPYYLDYLNDIGMCYIKVGNYTIGISYFNKIIKMDSNDVIAINNIGFTHEMESDDEKAINCYKKAIKVDPDFYKAWENLGRVLYKKGRFYDALECYDHSTELNPFLWEAWQNKLEMYKILGRKPAIDQTEKKIKSLASDIHRVGYNYYKQKRYGSAIFYCNLALKFNPKVLASWNIKALCYSAMKKYHEAIKCYDEALIIDPDYKTALESRKTILDSFLPPI